MINGKNSVNTTRTNSSNAKEGFKIRSGIKNNAAQANVSADSPKRINNAQIAKPNDQPITNKFTKNNINPMP